MKKEIVLISIIILIAILGALTVRRVDNALTCYDSTANRDRSKTYLEMFDQGVSYAIKGQKREFLTLYLWKPEKAKYCYELALQSYNDALFLKSDDVGALENRATIFMDLGEYDAAIDDFLKVLEINPENQHARNGIARAYEQSGDGETAVLKYEEAVAFMENSDYWNQLHPKTIEDYRSQLEYLRSQIEGDD